MAKLRSLTFHQGSRLSQGHNIRNEKIIAKQTHIDREKSTANEILTHEPIKEAYERLFGEAVKKWNETQKNQERHIKNYLRTVKYDGNRKKPVYEIIVQVGTMKDSGTKDEDAAAVLREYAKNFQKRNPSLVVIGAYIHRDEACSHLHLDYIPVVYGQSRGLETQVNLGKALHELGYDYTDRKNTAQMQFQKAERAYLAELALSHGIEILKNVGVEQRKHLEIAQYKNVAEEIKEYKLDLAADYQNARQKYENLQKASRKIDEIETGINMRQNAAIETEKAVSEREAEVKKAQAAAEAAKAAADAAKTAADERAEAAETAASERAKKAEQDAVDAQEILEMKKQYNERKNAEFAAERAKMASNLEQMKKEYQEHKRALTAADEAQKTPPIQPLQLESAKPSTFGTKWTIEADELRNVVARADAAQSLKEKLIIQGITLQKSERIERETRRAFESIREKNGELAEENQSLHAENAALKTENHELHQYLHERGKETDFEDWSAAFHAVQLEQDKQRQRRRERAERNAFSFEM